MVCHLVGSISVLTAPWGGFTLPSLSFEDGGVLCVCVCVGEVGGGLCLMFHYLFYSHIAVSVFVAGWMCFYVGEGVVGVWRKKCLCLIRPQWPVIQVKTLEILVFTSKTSERWCIVSARDLWDRDQVSMGWGGGFISLNSQEGSCFN